MTKPATKTAKTRKPTAAKANGRMLEPAKAKTAAKPKTVAKPASDAAAVDARILSMLAETGACKIGVLRAAYIAADEAFAALGTNQQNGIMRRSVRRLETAKKISKSGMIFAVR
jgi:hypothetical protein